MKRPRSGAGYVATLGVSLALVACTGSTPPIPSPAPVSLSVGSAGGVLTGNGVAITIPPGALSSSTTIEIVKDPAGPPAAYVALSPLFRFAPDGLTFARPATVSFVTSANTPGGRVFWSTAGGGYQLLPTTWSGTTASAEVQHFSGGFVGFVSPSVDGGPGDGGVPVTDASQPLGAVGDSCNVSTVVPGLPYLPCQSNLECLGGICANPGPSGYCDDNAECDPNTLGCGGPYENFCIVATHTCGCACNCDGACMECAARVGGLGDPCGTTGGTDPRTGTWYTDCVLSLTCVNGTCQSPDAGFGEGGSPEAAVPDSGPDATTPATDGSSSVDASTDDGSPPPPGGVGDSCNVSTVVPGLPYLPCQSNLECLGGICANPGPSGYCDDNAECDPNTLGCGGPYENFCIVATHTCGCACNCDGACMECAARVGGLGDPCGTTGGTDPRTGTWYTDCVLSLTCVNGTCQ